MNKPVYTKLVRPCHAINKLGRPCRNEAEKGEWWCLPHLMAGYKIFDRAVAVETAAAKLFKSKEGKP
jgi:hypothetical protein